MNVDEIKKIIENNLYYLDGKNQISTICKLCNTEKVHNCFACNLADSIDCIYELSICLSNNSSNYHIYRLFLPQLYLIVEEIDKIIFYSDILKKSKGAGNFTVNSNK